MRRYDNAAPRATYVGDDAPRTWLPGDRCCCRDGYARMCMVRPVLWERPAGPTGRDVADETTRLCLPCRRKRIACGAQDLDCYR